MQGKLPLAGVFTEMEEVITNGEEKEAARYDVGGLWDLKESV